MEADALAERIRLDLPELRRSVRENSGTIGDPDLHEAMKRLQGLGALEAVVPMADGGAGLALDPEAAPALCTILRRLGRADLSLARLYEGHVNAARLIEVHGGRLQLRHYKRIVREGGILAVWGADADPPVSLHEGPEGILHLAGRKRFASGVGIVTHALVTATSRDGGRLVLVEAGEPARHEPDAWTASAMRASVSGGFDAEGISVEAEQLLGDPEALLVEPYFEGGTWRYCAAHVGGAEALVEETRRALRAGGRSGDPIQRARLGRMYALADTARLVTEAAARTTEASATEDDAVIRLAVARALLARETVEGCCTELLTLCERALGMGAHDTRHAVDGIRRDLSLFLRQAAPDGKLDRAVAELLGDEAPEVGEAW